MPTYSKEALNSLNNSSALSLLEKDAEDANSLAKAIESFYNESVGTLKGAAWDQARKHLNNYLEIQKLRADTALNLKNIITDTNNILIDTIGDEPSINTDELEELKLQYKNYTSTINSLYSKIKVFDKESDEYKDLNQQIKDNTNASINIKNMIDKIEIFKEVEQKALVSLSNSDFNTYNSEVDSLNIPTIIYSKQV